MTNFREVQTTKHEEGRQQRFATFKATQVIWLLLGLLESMLALRVMFKLVGVNPDNPFATLLYGVTGFFVAPFASLAGAPSAGGMVLEVSSIIAMIVYLLVTWGLVRVVHVLFYRPRGPVSVRQTSVAEHIPQPQAPSVVDEPVETGYRTVTTTETPVSTGTITGDTEETYTQSETTTY